MPELPPKRSGDIASFDRLSRTIGDGSLRLHGDKPARVIRGKRGAGPAPVPGYAELQVTSNFSFLRGASHPDELVVTAAALGHQAIAITDRNSLAGIVRAHHAAKTIGIRLVIGVRLDLADGASLLAFPEDRAAYGRLTRLLTLGKRRAPKGECHLDYADVAAHGEGQILVVLPPNEGDVAEFAARAAADFRGRAYLAAHHLYRGDDSRRLARLAEIADKTGLPLLATNDVHYHVPERRPLQDVVTCIREHCTIAEAGFRLAAHAERHLKPASEMARLFHGYEDALARSLEIVERCRFNLDELRYEYPEEPVPPGTTPQQWLTELVWRGAREKFPSTFRDSDENPSPPFRGEREGPAPQAWEGEVGRRWTAGVPPACRPEAGGPFRSDGIAGGASFETTAARSPQDDESLGDGIKDLSTPEGFLDDGIKTLRHPEERSKSASRRTHDPSSSIPDHIRKLIAYELELIEQLDFARYFLTVHDIVSFARSQDILCQGRGSAANSVVCYCLGITSVDPARIDVLFERFISTARNEPPDIDVDFEHERREEVIQYVYDKYGRDRAGIVATVICYRARGAIREVGKVLGLSGDVVAALAGIVWGWSNEGIADARVREAGLDPRDRNLRLALDLAHELIGFPRHLSQHVGGFVITRGPLSELVPIENAAMADRTFIEWDKDDLDALGILKIDILALGMLTCIRKSFALIEQHYGRPYTLATIPAEHPLVYQMLSRADSIGVFQVESRAQMSMLPRLKPREFYDLVIEVAIVRPGPIQGDMVHPYLCRRSGKEAVEYPSDELRQVLGKTLGVPLFQEQAMKIAIVGAGFPPDEADRLRRAMATFKRNGEIHLFRDKFIAGMVANRYTRDFATRCFDQIEGFGTYGFPESHAASFALLVYVSAWIKCFHPDVFACALLNSQPMGFYAPAQLVRDARDHGVEVRPVDVNFSDWDCTLEPLAATAENPSPPFRGEREGPAPQAREGEVGFDWTAGVSPATCGRDGRGPSGIPHLTPTLSAPQGTQAGGEGDIRGRCALRLGLRQIKGFAEADAERLVMARGAGYADAADLWRRSGLGRAALERLAEADALRSLNLDRRRGLWALKALGETPLPLFAAAKQPLQTRLLSFETRPGCRRGAPQDDEISDGIKNHRHPEEPAKPASRRTHDRDPANTNEIFTAADRVHAPHPGPLPARPHPSLPRERGRVREGAPLPARGERESSFNASTATLTRKRPQQNEPFVQSSPRVPSPRLRGEGQGEGLSGDAASNETHAASLLPEMPLGEHVVEDYATLGLTIKRHPLAFLRAELKQEGLVKAADLATLPNQHQTGDRRVSIAGLVLIRQRPGSANGVVFVTLEDETGIANLIVWPATLERFRRAALGATLLYCRGRLQREESVIHIVAEDLKDWTRRLNTLRDRTGNEPPPAIRKSPFALPERIPGYDPREIVIPSRDFR
jgi:DNA polymerase III alpha subunit